MTGATLKGKIPLSEIVEVRADDKIEASHRSGEYINLTVNGNKMTANVGQNLTIDTDLMIAYRTDGTSQNTEVTGEYEDLWLPPGENSVSVTAGFSLTVIPNWRCL